MLLQVSMSDLKVFLKVSVFPKSSNNKYRISLFSKQIHFIDLFLLGNLVYSRKCIYVGCEIFINIDVKVKECF